MSKPVERVEIISSNHRRRRYTAEEKVGAGRTDEAAIKLLYLVPNLSGRSMVTTAARVVRGQNPIRHPIRRWIHGLIHVSYFVHKITNRAKQENISHGGTSAMG